MRSENAALAPVLFRNPEPDPDANPDPENGEHASARLGSSLCTLVVTTTWDYSTTRVL